MDKKPMDDQLSLEDILAEFAPAQEPPATPPAQEPPVREAPAALPQEPAPMPAVQGVGTPGEAAQEGEAVVETARAEQAKPRLLPVRKPVSPKEKEPPREEPAPRAPAQSPAPVPEAGEETGGEEAPAGEKREKLPWWKRKPQPVRIDEKVIQFPEEDRSMTGRIGRLIEKGDSYAQKMFEGDAPEDPERERRERLLPGVDWEEEPTHAPAPRRRRVRRDPKPDIPPGKLAQRYKKGLGFLHTRTFLALLWCLPQLYLMLSQSLSLPLPGPLADNAALRCQLAAAAMGVSALLVADVLAVGLWRVVQLRPERESVLLLAVVAAGLDALTMPTLGGRDGAAPYCAVVSCCLFFAAWGRLLKRRGLWQSCRAAAGAAEPYLVTLEERIWNGQDGFTKWSGTVEGYGSQIQDTDPVQRTYHIAAPLVLLFALAFSLLASVGQKRPELFFWCLSACLTAACGFAGFLSFAMPYASLSRRLSKLGAALGGWDGMSWAGNHRGVILTDTDLFPPGSVKLNGIKLLGDVSLETAVAYTATLIRETGSGMEKPFADMLRTKGGLYRRVSQVVCHEGGVTGVIAGQAVYVGSGAFMELMGVTMPQGLKVRTAVFCALDGEIAAIFALNYALHNAVRPAVDSLIANGMEPILATRDFLVIPAMLRQRFKLPTDRMEFPSLDRRRELSSRRREHEGTLSAVLCREGLGPYAEAVVGSKRLRFAARAGILFDLLGSALGLVMAFYLCLAQAFASLSAGTLLLFLTLWLVPAVLISGWVNRY